MSATNAFYPRSSEPRKPWRPWSVAVGSAVVIAVVPGVLLLSLVAVPIGSWTGLTSSGLRAVDCSTYCNNGTYGNVSPIEYPTCSQVGDCPSSSSSLSLTPQGAVLLVVIGGLFIGIWMFYRRKPRRPVAVTVPKATTMDTQNAQFRQALGYRVDPIPTQPITQPPTQAAPTQAVPAQAVEGYCPSCGGGNAKASAFCESCGRPLPARP